MFHSGTRQSQTENQITALFFGSTVL
jgi:hypothetical protein